MEDRDPLGAVLWPALLLTYGILQLGIGPVDERSTGVVVGAVNTAVGVGIHQGAVWLYRLIQSR